MPKRKKSLPVGMRRDPRGATAHAAPGNAIARRAAKKAKARSKKKPGGKKR